MKKQVRRKRRNKGISGETLMIVTLNAFVLGMLVMKVAICGTSWLSTIGYFG